MSGKVLKIEKKKRDPNQLSRQAFLQELMEQDASQWRQALEAGEHWALARKAKRFPETDREMEDRKGFVSRKAKLKQLKEAKNRKKHSLFYVGNEPESITQIAEDLKNFSFAHTGNPKQALEILNHKTFSVIILEYDLPLANAIQFLNTYKTSRSIEEQVVAILVPENTPSSSKKMAAQLGVKIWLEKPYSEDVLTKCIRRLVGTDHG